MRGVRVRTRLLLCAIFFFISPGSGSEESTSVHELKGQRIAIVGAGVSGISTAHHLVNAGYNDITIFEASYRTGGWITSFEYKNVSYDMSTFAGTSIYWRFRNTLEALGAEFCPFDVSIIITGQGGASPKILNILEFFAAQSATQLEDPTTYPEQLRQQVQRYVSLWSELFEIPYLNENFDTDYLFPPRAPSDPEKLRKLAMPMGQLLREEGLELLVPIMRVIVNTQAYGIMDNTAALYVMTWVPPAVVAHSELSTYTPCGKYGTFQKLVDLLVENFNGKVQIRFGTKVKGVRRGRGLPVVVSESGTREVFDKVIVTRKLPQVKWDKFLVGPVLEEERELAQSVQSIELYTGMYEGPREGVIGGDRFALLDALSAADPETGETYTGSLTHERKEPGGPFHSDENTLVREFSFFFYKEGEESKPVNLTASEKDSIVLEKAKAWDQTKWTPIRGYSFRRYNQRFSGEFVQREYPWAVRNKLQGKGGVYFISAHVCGFESVAHLFDCAKHLVDDHF